MNAINKAKKDIQKLELAIDYSQDIITAHNNIFALHIDGKPTNRYIDNDENGHVILTNGALPNQVIRFTEKGVQRELDHVVSLLRGNKENVTVKPVHFLDEVERMLALTKTFLNICEEHPEMAELMK